MKRHIEASTKVRAALERARDVLLGDPGCVLSECCSANDPRTRCFPTTLAVDVGAGGGLHQKVLVDLGLARSTDDAVAVPVQWNAAARERLFPTFEGELEVTRDDPGSRLVLTGAYTVPLGSLGRFGDGVAGRRLAHRALSAFVEQSARRLDVAVDRRTESVSWHPAPYPVSMREIGSENYVG